MSDSKGHDLEKDIAVRVTSVESKQVRIMILWKFESITDKAPFIFGYAQPKRVANANVHCKQLEKVSLSQITEQTSQKGMYRYLTANQCLTQMSGDVIFQNGIRCF